MTAVSKLRVFCVLSIAALVACHADEPDDVRNPDPSRDGVVAYNEVAASACGVLEDGPTEVTGASAEFDGHPVVVQPIPDDTTTTDPSPTPGFDTGSDTGSWYPDVAMDAGGWEEEPRDAGGWDANTADASEDTATTPDDAGMCDDTGDAGDAGCEDAGEQGPDAGGGQASDAGTPDAEALDAGSSDAGSSPAPDESAPKCEPVAGVVASSTESYAVFTENDFVRSMSDALATFSLDVDTASYGLARRNLDACAAPAPGSVRIEEFLNAFHYDYPRAAGCEAPFSVYTEAGPSPFGGPRGMLHIGVQTDDVGTDVRPDANLVFLIDVSGSMSEELPLVQSTLRTLLANLGPDDRLAIVTYASDTRVVLPTSSVADRAVIERAIDGLTAGGATAGGAGIELAYDLALGALRPGGINRVILCTDGDFNVGVSQSELIPWVAARRDQGIALTVLGYGNGNLHDDFLEEVTNVGNGNYSYIATPADAVRVAERDLSGTLQIVASDVKIQVEVNTELVSRHRLVGYDNRVLDHWQFDDDTVDAADVGAGQGVTALLELEWTVDPRSVPGTTVLAEVRVRFKFPGETKSLLLRRQILARDVVAELDATSPMFRWSVAVAEFAEVLRDSRHVSAPDLDRVLAIAAPIATDADREEFVDLVRRARALLPSGL